MCEKETELKLQHLSESGYLSISVLQGFSLSPSRWMLDPSCFQRAGALKDINPFLRCIFKKTCL